MAKDEERAFCECGAAESKERHTDWCPASGDLSEEELRGFGRTTKAIREAPKGAVFIWHAQASIGYPRKIAREIGRDDLRFATVEDVNSGRLLGVNANIVFDHHALEQTIDFGKVPT